MTEPARPCPTEPTHTGADAGEVPTVEPTAAALTYRMGARRAWLDGGKDEVVACPVCGFWPVRASWLTADYECPEERKASEGKGVVA